MKFFDEEEVKKQQEIHNRNYTEFIGQHEIAANTPFWKAPKMWCINLVPLISPPPTLSSFPISPYVTLRSPLLASHLAPPEISAHPPNPPFFDHVINCSCGMEETTSWLGVLPELIFNKFLFVSTVDFDAGFFSCGRFYSDPATDELCNQLRRANALAEVAPQHPVAN